MIRTSAFVPVPDLLKEAGRWLVFFALVAAAWLALTSADPERSWLGDFPAATIVGVGIALAMLSLEVFRQNPGWAALRVRSAGRTAWFRSLSVRSGDLVLTMAMLLSGFLLAPRLQWAVESGDWLRVAALAVFISFVLASAFKSFRSASRASAIVSITDEQLSAEQLPEPVPWNDVRHLGRAAGVSPQAVLIYLRSSELPLRIELGDAAVSLKQFAAEVARLRPEIQLREFEEGSIARPIPGLG